MTNRTDALHRALHERGEHGITDPIALAALNAMVRQSMLMQWNAWVTQVGEDHAALLWLHHFGDDDLLGRLRGK